MSKSELTLEELELVHRLIDLGPGTQADREDLWQAEIARDTGGRLRKVGPGLYQFITDPPGSA